MKLKRLFCFKKLNMSDNKKSFLLYSDWIYTVEKLDDEQAGKLLKHLLRYVNGLNPEPENQILDLVFEPIKMQLKRDSSKYESIVKKRSEAGKKSAELRRLRFESEQQVLTNPTSVESVEQVATNPTDNDNVNDNDNDNVNDNVNVNDSVNDIIINNNSDDKKNKSTTNGYKDDKAFIEDWNYARVKYLKVKASNIRTLTHYELINFRKANATYTIDEFRKGMEGLLMQKEIFDTMKLRPNHFLDEGNIDKYIDAFNNKKHLYKITSKDGRL